MISREELRLLLIEKHRQPIYIGDSVYIHFDGYHFILETRNGLPTDPSNRIALEPPVIDALLNYREKCYEEFERLNEME